MKKGRPIAALALAVATLALTPALAETSYPLVFSSASQLAKLGIAWGTAAPLAKRCYSYGEGADALSFNAALLSFYQSQGFTKRSACLALVSGIRFNPESGRRLATFVWVDASLFKNGRPDPKHWSDGAPTELGLMSGELPLSLPNCFRRGLPFTDCAWRFDAMTGKAIAAADSKKHQDVGAAIDKLLANATLRQRFAADPSKLAGSGFILVSGFARNWSVTDDPLAASYDQPWHGVAFDYLGGELPIHVFYDFSDELPDGRGYALLFGNDGAGADVPAALIKTVIARQRQPAQLDTSQPRQIWGTGVR